MNGKDDTVIEEGYYCVLLYRRDGGGAISGVDIF